MILRQFLNERLSAMSYLVGCGASNEAMVIDPGLPPETYLLVAAQQNLRITAIIETHMHADYLSTGRALASQTEATIFLPARAEAQFPHHPVQDNEQIVIGRLCLQALHTPGHTPEHMAYSLTDPSRGTEPWLMFTGDCLFVNDVGRTDLVDLPLTGPSYQFKSLQRLLALPDYVEIYPAHYGGSACGGAQMSGKLSSTIGFERRFSPGLQFNDEESFAAWIGETKRDTVDDILQHRNINRGLLPLPEEPSVAKQQAAHTIRPIALSIAESESLLHSGVIAIDLRPALRFAEAHLPGALNVPYHSEALAQRVAALTTPYQSLILLGDSVFIARLAAEQLLKQDRNPIAGYVDFPDAIWLRIFATTRIPNLSLEDLAFQRCSGESLLLDVRDPSEWQRGSIPGSLQIALDSLRDQLEQVPQDRPIVVICESGARASSAASLLRHKGFGQVTSVAPDGVSSYLEMLAEYPID